MSAKGSDSRDIRDPPGARTGSGRELLDSYVKNPSPLQEQFVPLTTEPPLQDPRDHLGHVAS